MYQKCVLSNFLQATILASICIYLAYVLTIAGYAVVQLVEALRYGFDSRWGHCKFSLT